MEATKVLAPGKLKITIHHAKELHNEDFGKQDPYVKMKIGNQEKATIVKFKAGTEAFYGESFDFILTGKEDLLNLAAWDKDKMSDDLIGRNHIPLDKLVQECSEGEVFYRIYTKDMSKVRGQVGIQVEYIPFVDGVLKVILLKGKKLKNKDVFKQDPFVDFKYVNPITKQEQKHKSKVIQKGGTNVEWNEEFMFDICNENSFMRVRAYDEDPLSNDFIGGAHIKIADLIASIDETDFDIREGENTKGDGGYKKQVVGTLVMKCEFTPKYVE